jgi:hypothetical protein
MRRAAASKTRCLIGVLGSIWIVSASWTVSHAADSQGQTGREATAGSLANQLSGTVTKYCIGCHNDRTRSGGLLLDQVDFSNLPAGAPVWEKVVRKLRAGMMPPPGLPRPDRATQEAVIASVAAAHDPAAAANPNPGRPVLRRLNRTEYSNEIRDLLALDLDDVASLLPADNSAYGFDNVGDVLEVSPALLERYMTAAERLSAIAVGSSNIPPLEVTHVVRADLAGECRFVTRFRSTPTTSFNPACFEQIRG